MGKGLSSIAQTIWVEPATYDSETLPLIIGDGQTVVGDVATRGQFTRIQGSGPFFAVNTAVIILGNSTLQGIGVRPGEAADAAVFVNGDDVAIDHCTIECSPSDDSTHCSDGIRAVGFANLRLTSNSIDGKWQNFNGVPVTGSGRGVVFDNMTGMMQDTSVSFWPVNNVVVTGTMVDLGGGGVSTGGNNFTENKVNAAVFVSVGNQVLHATQGIWCHNPPTTSTNCASKVDFCSPSGDTLDFSAIRQSVSCL